MSGFYVGIGGLVLLGIFEEYVVCVFELLFSRLLGIVVFEEVLIL